MILTSKNKYLIKVASHFCFGYIAEQSETTQEKEERSYGSLMMERVTGSQEGRIDHVLQVRA